MLHSIVFVLFSPKCDLPVATECGMKTASYAAFSPFASHLGNDHLWPVITVRSLSWKELRPNYERQVTARTRSYTDYFYKIR